MAVDLTRRSYASLYVMPAAGGPWIRISDGTSYDDKPRWAPDGRAIYFVSDRGGFANVWGVRMDPGTGRSTSAPFRVTGFDSAGKLLDLNMGRVEIAVARDRLFVPVTETAAELWMLTGLDP
jgi:dipeptidyl aminopeptidase/acylaminoacyl peptidase